MRVLLALLDFRNVYTAEHNYDTEHNTAWYEASIERILFMRK